MALTSEADLFLPHVATSLTLVTSRSASGEPTLSTSPILNVPCFFESVNKMVRFANGDIVPVIARVFFGSDNDINARSKIVFAGVTYDVVQVQKFYNDDEGIHHYEVLCR